MFDEGPSFGLKVPMGRLANGELVPVKSAQPGSHHVCPGCGGELVLHDGPVRVKHFVHKQTDVNHGESWLHYLAKEWLFQVYSRQRKQCRMPLLIVPCEGLGSPNVPRLHVSCRHKAILDLRQWVYDEVGMEIALPNRYRPDLLLRSKGLPVLGIEVRATHAVDAMKMVALGIPWFEVDACAVLNSPWRLHPVEWNFQQSVRCPSCNSFEMPQDITPEEFHLQALRYRVNQIVHSKSGRSTSIKIAWHCPRCRQSNKRTVFLDPEVHIRFQQPLDPFHPTAIHPLPASPELILSPDPLHPDRPLMIGTGLTGIFICPKCHYDGRAG